MIYRALYIFLSVRVSSSYRDTGGMVVSISQLYQNPRYDYWTVDYDISVLRLSSTLTFGSAIAAVALPEFGQ